MCICEISLEFVNIIIYCYVGGKVCTDSVDILVNGNNEIDHDKQAIIPQFNFACNGRITSIRAKVRFNNANNNYPYFQVWRPVSIGSMIYNKTGEVQLESDYQVTGDGDHRLAIIILTDNNTIEVQSGDVVGFYHSSKSRYQVRTRNTDGYILYQFDGSSNSNSIDLGNVESNINRRQPMIQFSIGNFELINPSTFIIDYF